MSYMRPHNRHARYRNLYFVGASTHPGTGLPNVLMSARFAAGRILKDDPVSPRELDAPVRLDAPIDGPLNMSMAEA
jgi:hypothetical protein